MGTQLTAQQYACVVDRIMVARSRTFNALYRNLAHVPKRRWHPSPAEPHNLASPTARCRLSIGSAGMVPVSFCHNGRSLEHYVATYRTKTTLVVYDPALPRLRQTRWFGRYEAALKKFMVRSAQNGRVRFVHAPGGPVQTDPESYTDPMCSFYSSTALRYLITNRPLPRADRLRRTALVDALRQLRRLSLL